MWCHHLPTHGKHADPPLFSKQTRPSRSSCHQQICHWLSLHWNIEPKNTQNRKVQEDWNSGLEMIWRDGRLNLRQRRSQWEPPEQQWFCAHKMWNNFDVPYRIKIRVLSMQICRRIASAASAAHGFRLEFWSPWTLPDDLKDSVTKFSWPWKEFSCARGETWMRFPPKCREKSKQSSQDQKDRLCDDTGPQEDVENAKEGLPGRKMM